MSTRSRTRNHPYQRRRSVRQRERQSNTAAANTNMASEQDLGGCIDLTGNDSIDTLPDVIDLTNQSTITDADPVVVISPTDVNNADTFTGAQRRRRHRIVLGVVDDETGEPGDNEGFVDAREEPSPSSSSASSSSRVRRHNSTINLDDSDEDLPDVPFHVPDSNAASGSSPVKATCPICLETDSQIRQDRQLYSTVCGHIFCSTCIKQAIDTQHSCPSCRKRLTKKQIHQIFL